MHDLDKMSRLSKELFGFVDDKIAECTEEDQFPTYHFYLVCKDVVADPCVLYVLAEFLESRKSGNSVTTLPDNTVPILCNNCDGYFIFCECPMHDNLQHLHCVRCNGTVHVGHSGKVKQRPS